MHTIYISAEDNARLRLLLLLSPYTDGRQRERELLRRELDRAAILPPTAGPAEVVGLGVAFEYEDLDTGTTAIGCLCLPGEEATTPHAISVLSRFGAAVIGCRAGNELWWAELDRPRRIRIQRILTEEPRRQSGVMPEDELAASATHDSDSASTRGELQAAG